MSSIELEKPLGLKPARNQRLKPIQDATDQWQGIEHLAGRATQIAEDVKDLFAQAAFYVELAPLDDHDNFVDSIYILKDRGRLTANRLTFASPLRELAFSFRDSVPGSGPSGKVVVNEPNFDHRRKGRAFFGWIIGIKFKPTWSGALCAEDPVIVACQDSLARHRVWSVVSRSP
jgi:hypothetical protein